ncbi:MAG: 16S rRNA (cytidine(1402)-2'-O)-methyltransferase [Pseudomonadota bacterium]
MTALFAPALPAADAAASGQHYPQASLYVVATPIGNLADMTLRSLHVLGLVDAIACEDTRHTQALLRAYGIDKPLLAVHEHNEAQAAVGICERLQQGQRIAYVSDAGTPAVSDPGARLVAAVRAQGFRVLPIPGASSVTAALSVAGLSEGSGFVFGGFLSSKAAERASEVLALAQEARAVVLLESPHRIEALARALEPLGERTVTVGRELTKQFEEIASVAAQELPGWLAENPQRLRGEFVLVLHAQPLAADSGNDLRVLGLLLEELPLKAAVKLAAEITGSPRNALYDAALQMKKAAAENGAKD